MNITDTQAASLDRLIAHLEDLNAQRRARMAADPLLWCSMYPTDRDYWVNIRKITSIADWERSSYMSEYSDLHKELYNFRPRVDWSSMSTPKIYDRLLQLREEAYREANREVIEAKEAQEEQEREELLKLKWSSHPALTHNPFRDALMG